MRALSLFTGGGGLDLGMESSGFDIRFCIDKDPAAVDVLVNNQRHGVLLPNAEIRLGDAEEFPYDARITFDVDLLIGGASCQPFSIAGRHAGPADPRDTFPAVFKAIRSLGPKMVVLENVRGLLRPAFREYFEHIARRLGSPFDEGGAAPADDRALKARPLSEQYDVVVESVNAADFGVPQQRHRLFLVAVRRDLRAAWPGLSPTHSEERLWHQQCVSGEYWTRHGIARRAPVGFRQRLRSGCDSMGAWRTARDACSDLPEPAHDMSPVFPSWHTFVPGARSYPGHNGSCWDRPAKTVKAGVHGVAGGENAVQGDDGGIRYFTMRELARLQTFPDDYRLPTSRTAATRILGNAVPPTLAEAIGRAAAELLKCHSGQGSGN